MDVEKKRRKADPVNQSDTSEQISMDSSTSKHERRSKRFKSSSDVNICVICGSDCKTVKQTKIHKLVIESFRKAERSKITQCCQVF